MRILCDPLFPCHPALFPIPATDYPCVQVYVDALGPTKTYEAYLSSTFPGINFTVTAKADSKFKIVGAASVAAKVTRDAWVEGWMFEEHQVAGGAEAQPEKPTWGSELGSGYPSGKTGLQEVEVALMVADTPARPEDAGVDQELP